MLAANRVYLRIYTRLRACLARTIKALFQQFLHFSAECRANTIHVKFMNFQVQRRQFSFIFRLVSSYNLCIHQERKKVHVRKYFREQLQPFKR